MQRALTSSLLGITTLALATVLSGCNARKADTESASASTTDSASEGSSAKGGTVPITAASDEARKLYLEGRTLSEQLRAHDGRALYEQAAAKDPSFAMAHYQLAANSATAKDFFAHLKQAVALSGKASEGERLMILALEAGGNAQPAKALEYQQELVAKYPERRARPLPPGHGVLRPAGVRQGHRAVPEGHRRSTPTSPPPTTCWATPTARSRSTTTRRPRSRSTSS